MLRADREPSAFLAVLDDVIDLEDRGAGPDERAAEALAELGDVLVGGHVEPFHGQGLGDPVDDDERRPIDAEYLDCLAGDRLVNADVDESGADDGRVDAERE